MRTFYQILIFSLFLSACGQQSVDSNNMRTPLAGSDLENKNSSSTSNIANETSPRQLITINQNSTAPFSPVSVDARYKDCAGSILYNVRFEGTNNSSLTVYSQLMPKLNYWYTLDQSNINSAPSQRPSINTFSYNDPTLTLNYADPKVSTAILFTVASSDRLAFNFRITYKDGRVLSGSADVPLTQGSQVACK